MIDQELYFSCINDAAFFIFNLDEMGSTKHSEISIEHVDINFTLVTDAAIAFQALPKSWNFPSPFPMCSYTTHVAKLSNL